MLIVTTDGYGIRDRMAEILMDVQMETGASLEIVTCHVDDLFPLIDHFLKNVLTHGQEVYSMPRRGSVISAAIHYLALAQEYYDSAKDAISRGDHRLGLDGAYNSAELAVKGFLVMKMADLPGSAGGMIQRFGETYIRPGKVERTIGRRLNVCLELGNSARYKFSSRVTREDADLVITLAGDLIALLERELGTPFRKYGCILVAARRPSEPDSEILSGTCLRQAKRGRQAIADEAKRPQIPMSEPGGRVWDLQRSEARNGRKKALKGDEDLLGKATIRDRIYGIDHLANRKGYRLYGGKGA